MRDHEKDKAANLPLADLIDPPYILRPVKRDSIEYLELKDAIDREGLTSSISVRPSLKTPGKYEVVTGRWRTSVCTELGWQTIPCIIKHGVTDEILLAIQVQEQACRPETTVTDYANRLQRILERNPGMTSAELALKVGKQQSWVSQQLSLTRLPKRIALMVDRGEIPLANAYMLAKLPTNLRELYVDHARSTDTKEFKSLTSAAIKQFTEAVHQGKLDLRYMPKHEPVANLRKIKEIKSELETPTVAGLLIASEGCTSLTEAFRLALKWAVHLDKESVEHQAKINARNLQSNQLGDTTILN